MICKNCNQIIDDNAKFCPNCGTPQNPASQENRQQESGSQDPYSQDTAQPNTYSQDETQNPSQNSQPQYYYDQPDNGYYNQAGNNQSGYYNQADGYNQYGGAYHNPGEAINSTPYLVFAILSTICCCIPLGVPAIVFASKISTAQQMGRMDEARDCAKKAKIFSIIAAVVGVVASIIYFIVIIAANSAYYY